MWFFFVGLIYVLIPTLNDESVKKKKLLRKSNNLNPYISAHNYRDYAKYGKTKKSSTKTTTAAPNERHSE